MSRTGDSEESICVGCGLCCDGTVVTHLAVRDESDLGRPLQTLGVEVIFAAEPPVFELPCPALCDGICSIHSLHRPSACAQFECELSLAVLEGRKGPAEARAVVREALLLRAQSSDEAGERVFKDFIQRNFKGKERL